MLAVGFQKHGEPEVLEQVELPDPELRGGQDVLVRIVAAGINPADWQVRKFGAGFDWNGAKYTVPGLEGAGVVEAVGKDVTAFKPGDEVYYVQGGYPGSQGNYAQYNIVDARFLALKPKSLDFLIAAALPTVLITAWEALYDRAGLVEGQSALIHGGAGGVGHIGVQLAVARGARVASTVSTSAKADLVASLGAERVIRYRDENVGDTLRVWSGQDGADVVFDTVGGANFAASFPQVAPYGKLVSCVVADWPTTNTYMDEYRNISIGLENMGYPQIAGHEAGRLHQTDILAKGAAMVDAGTLKVVVDQAFTFDTIIKAHTDLEAGRFTGRIVVQIPS